MTDAPTTRILFVCTGNTCRSPMAASYMHHLCRSRGITDVEVDSAGVAAGRRDRISPQAEAVLAEVGVVPLRLQSQPLTAKLVRSADLVVTMTNDHRQQVEQRYGFAHGKTLALLSLVNEPGDVADPIGGSRARYRECLEQMKPGLVALVDKLAR